MAPRGGEAIRVAREPYIIGECRVAMATGQVVGYALCSIPIESLTDLGAQDGRAVDVLETGLDRDRESRTAEAEVIAGEEVPGWSAFKTRANRECQAFDL